jgi:pimeloyl-ACP methyl ester carboxylesterase
MNSLKYIGNIERCKKSVLFIPGSLISPEVYDNVTLPDGYQGVKVSWINSDCNIELQDVADEIIRFVRDYDLKSVILAGYSSGGVISMLAYLSDKEAISGLLLSNTGANTVNQTNTDLPNRIKTNWCEKDNIEFIKRCFYKPLDDEMFNKLLEYANRLTSEQFLRPVLSLRKIDLREKLSDIECPVIIAHGNHDRVRRIEHARILYENIKNSELILLDAGHSPMYEDSENYSKALLKLIKRVEEN